MQLNGREIAEAIYQKVSADLEELSPKPTLGIIVVGHDPVIESFVGIKKRNAERLGIPFIRQDLPDTATQQVLNAAINKMNSEHDGIIVQLPLPKHLSTDEALKQIDASRDVDALNPLLPELEKPVHAPVAEAVMELLRFAKVNPKGKKAVVIGAGRLVGAPSAELLKQAGADVHMVTLEQGKLEDAQDADIVVSGAGKAGLIRPEYIKKDAILIDGGTSEQGKKITGDIDPACYEKAAFYTPVPGGVGPVAVAKIFENLLTLINRK